MSLVEKPLTLREKQVSKLKKMIHLNQETNNNLLSPSNQEELIWKVLVMDRHSTAIVSSVLRVNDLLEYGITMHALIDQNRTPLPDVPAIYFVTPTAGNIAMIIDDINGDQYSTFYINFTSSLSRSLLEEFAKQVAKSGRSNRIKEVYDQYLDFIVTEPELFSLEMNNVYAKFNGPKTTEEQINSSVGTIVDGLFSSILTSGSMPIIRCNRGGPAELVAQRLDEKLRDYAINMRQAAGRNVDASVNLQTGRSVLVILDRNVDLSSMFAHSWIYQCMVSDAFKLERNTIEIDGRDKDGKPTLKRYDIDPNDFFWKDNSSLPFPDAVEHVEAELAQYTKEAKELTSKTGYSSIKDIDPNDKSDTAHIQEAIKALPELTQRKNIIDMHMSVLTDLIKQLEAKSLDSFFEVEQSLGDQKTQNQFLELLKDDSKNDNAKDKLRTYIVMYLKCDLPKSYCNQCEELLNKTGVDMSALSYVKKVKELNKLSAMSTLPTPETTNEQKSLIGGGSALFSGLSSKLMGLTTEGSSKLSEGVGSLISGIKNLLPEKTNLPITNIMESIMVPDRANQDSVKLTDDYLFFDPGATRGTHSKPPKRSSYTEGMAFVVGGGNYLEYSNLQDWCKNLNAAQGTANTQQHTVSYGSTKICSVDEFLGECSILGNDV